MSWFVATLTRSIGKKLCVALTGLALCGFLVAHLAGNLLLYVGPEAFNHYAEALTKNPLLPVAEIGLLSIFVVHMVLALYSTWENWRARPEPYRGKRAEGGRTIGSSTMWITGPLILIFLVVHLLDFRLAEGGGKTLHALVVEHFRSLPNVLAYAAAMLLVGIHVSHGFQSLFRSLGLVHPKYTPFVTRLGWAFAIVVVVGFGSIPFWIYFCVGRTA